MKKFYGYQAVALITASLVGSVSPVVAGGYEAKLWNSDSIGEALAGSAVKEGDITTITRNPASALGFMNKRYEVAATSAVVIPKVKFRNRGSTAVNGAVTPGVNGGNAGKDALVPAAYLAWNMNNNWKFGLAVTSPWGLKTEYDREWVGRYHAVKSEMKTINIMPAVSYKINDQLAIGGGVQIQYMDVKLTRAIDFGGIMNPNLQANGVPDAFLFPLQDPARQGEVNLKGDRWGYGWNLGLAYRITKALRVGLNYNSHVTQKLAGKAKFAFPEVANNPLAPAPINQAYRAVHNGVKAAARFQEQGIKASVKTPERVNFGAAWDFHPQITLLGEVNYTHWKRMKEIGINFPLTGTKDATPMKWKDTFSYHIGLNWRPSEEWILRTGYAFDPTPVRDNYRIPNVPDQDRHWAALGTTWSPTSMPAVSFSLNYAHEFVRKAKSELRPTGDNISRGNLIGHYKKGSVKLITGALKIRL
jgi:long-chain fatty acid transport protein